MNPLEFAREIERANRRLVELRRASRDASPTWVESALAELSSAIEELQVAEEELSSQNEELAAAHAMAEHERARYQELFVGSPYGQVLTDLRGVISEANRAAGDLLGAPSAGLAGKPLPLFIVLDERERFVRWLALLKDASHDATVCAECGGSAQFRIQTGTRSRVFPCELIAAPLADRFGRIQTIRWCLYDTSDRERAREADRLREEARRKDEFLAVLGHELRNPLAAISLAADILTARGGDPERKRWAAEVVERHADQLRRLVDDLLDVSRASHGKIALETEEVDLRRVVAAAIESCAPILKGKEHELSVTLPDEPVTLEGDPGRLTQVVTNLVDNAAKYTPSGGRIEVALKSGDGKVVIAVSDSGIGVEPDMLERIFGPYEQAEGTGNRGLGLGLALVKELVTLHGGTVLAASEGEGRGATFTVELPAARAGSPIRSGNGARQRARGHVAEAGHRILIVEDNTDAAELLADKLRQSGYAVEIALDGKGALAGARAAECLVALVDLGLPDLDGFEVCRRLKEEHPSLRVVALTGYSDTSSRNQANEAGFDRFLVKPLDPRAVVEVIEQLLPPPEKKTVSGSPEEQCEQVA
jgi:PAS domain S-box-containing protein